MRLDAAQKLLAQIDKMRADANRIERPTAPRDPPFVFPRFASTGFMTPVGKAIADKCWRLEFFRYRDADLKEWFRNRSVWPHIVVKLWNGPVAFQTSRILAEINGYDSNGVIRWFHIKRRTV